MKVTRIQVVVVILVLALLFAVQGGEYSTWDFMTLRREEGDEITRIAELRREVDSLEKEAKAVETDPATQERLARELYGMLRKGEYVYNIIWEEK
ncbi:MAG TPA: septum formation initiator family protein [Gemmatimonadales bacterium]|nr:septum formation initiator family protein [Gemmatimonadales bacterium]